jgi:hypothetical protein
VPERMHLHWQRGGFRYSGSVFYHHNSINHAILNQPEKINRLMTYSVLTALRVHNSKSLTHKNTNTIQQFHMDQSAAAKMPPEHSPIEHKIQCLFFR